MSTGGGFDTVDPGPWFEGEMMQSLAANSCLIVELCSAEMAANAASISSQGAAASTEVIKVWLQVWVHAARWHFPWLGSFLGPQINPRTVGATGQQSWCLQAPLLSRNMQDSCQELGFPLLQLLKSHADPSAQFHVPSSSCEPPTHMVLSTQSVHLRWMLHRGATSVQMGLDWMVSSCTGGMTQRTWC